jgi:hypothetical protein
MRLVLRLTALSIIILTLVLWFFGGMNLGRTKTTVMEIQKDLVTGIDFPVSESRFLPGLDFLGCGSAFGLVAVAVSFLFPKK